MLTGTKAATRWYSEDGIALAKEPKELVVIEGMTRADLYNFKNSNGQVEKKLIEFFGKYLV